MFTTKCGGAPRKITSFLSNSRRYAQVRSTVAIANSCISLFQDTVRIVEVGPRDGLQNEPVTVPTNIKVEFINRLNATGLKTIEVTRYCCPIALPFNYLILVVMLQFC